MRMDVLNIVWTIFESAIDHEVRMVAATLSKIRNTRYLVGSLAT
jgi:hypothetical protein